VIQIVRGRRLERVNVAALRIEAGHDVLDRAVLASSIHRLKDQQHGPPIPGVESVLELDQRFDAEGQRLLRPRLVLRFEVQRVSGVEVLDLESVVIGDAKRLGERAGQLGKSLQIYAG
jgi:hypothetical protein